MRLLRYALILSLVATAALAGPGATPYTGSRMAGGFAVTVIDTDIDQAFELVTADTGFTALSSAAVVRVEYAGKSKLDSLRTGSDTGDLVGVFTDGTTADQTAYANFFQDLGNGTVSTVSAAWGDGFSPSYNAYLERDSDSDYNMGDAWAIAVFSRGMSAGNPGVGTEQTVVCLSNATQQARIGYTPDGFLTGVVTDDNNTSIDSLVYAADVYDSTWVSAVFSCANSTLRLTVNDATTQTKSLSNATSVLGSMDNLTALASRGGANDFRGQIDELYIANDSHWLDAEMEEYLYARYLAEDGSSADTALVRIVGIGASDTLAKAQLCTVTVDAGDQTDSTYAVFENAYVEASRDHPLIVFSGADSPRGAKLDSIPQDLIHYPVAHVIADQDQTLMLERVIYTNYAANALTFQLRVYHNVYGTIDYTKDYEIKCPAYIASGGDPVEFDFGDGLYLGPNTAVAVFAKGAAANSDGSATLIGRRRWLR